MTARPEPLRPEAAATIILARQHAGELEVYLLKRHGRARFMPGMFVFPGGRLDPADRDGALWARGLDLEPEILAGRLGGDLSVEEAVAFGVAAVRETFEEAGVLLVRGAADGTERARLDGLRRSGNLPEGWLAHEAVVHGWTLSLSALGRWSRWLTPTGMKQRYDTVFFLARMVSGQECSPDGRETEQGLWVSPSQGLEKNLAGEVPLSPPILVTLQELLRYPTFEALEAEFCSPRRGETFAPRMVTAEQGPVIVEPWDPEFGQEEIPFPPRGLEAKVLPAGAPFSRIWFNGTLWRPIAL